MNIENAKIFLKEIKGVFDRYNVGYWLVRGTCLGIIRDKDLIKWDWDIDFCLLSEEICLKLKEDFIKKGFKLIEYGFILKKNNVVIDIYFGKFKEGKFLINVGLPPYKYPAKMFQSFQKIKFLKEDFNVPNPVEEYLEMTYGKNWKIPKEEGWQKDYLK